MKTILTASSAYTTNPNTPESDSQARIWHTVKDQFHNEHQVYAECPMTAIAQFNARKTEVEN